MYPRRAQRGPGDSNWTDHGQNQWELSVTASLPLGLVIRLWAGLGLGHQPEMRLRGPFGSRRPDVAETFFKIGPRGPGVSCAVGRRARAVFVGDSLEKPKSLESAN